MKLIINPFSGKLKKRGRLELFRKNVKKLLKNAYVEITRGPLHASEIAYNAVKNGIKTIVSVGGDGTFNEVVRGISGEDINIGLIPMGSGNDFARSLGLNRNSVDILKNLNTYKPKKIDIVSLGNGAIGTNVIGTGIDSDVIQILKKQGSRGYFLGFYKALIKHKTKDYFITLDNRKEFFKDVNLIIIANGKYFGRNMNIAPMASLNDGFLDIIIVKGLSRLQFFALFPRVYKGTHIDHPNCFIYKAKNITLENKNGFYYEYDGELDFTYSLNMSVLHNNLSILVPEF